MQYSDLRLFLGAENYGAKEFEMSFSNTISIQYDCTSNKYVEHIIPVQYVFRDRFSMIALLTST